MRYWDTLLETQRTGLDIILDKTWEDLPLDQLFDTSIDPDTGKPYFDVNEMAHDIDRGDLDYFMLRARVMFQGHELGSSIVGGFLYKDAREVLTDGTADDLIYEALREAQKGIVDLREGLSKIEVDSLTD